MAKRIIFVKGSDGALKTGLTLAWHNLYKVSDGTSIGAGDRPAFAEIGNGLYSTDPDTLITAQGDVVGVIDTTLTGADQYKPFYATTQDNDATIVSAPSGVYNVDLVTKEGDGTPIPETRVLVKNAGGSTIRDVTTDSNGNLRIQLDAGTFTFSSIKSGNTFADVVQTISAADTVILVGVPIVVPVPSAGFQTVYDTILRSDSNAAAGAVLTFQTTRKITQASDGTILTRLRVTATCDASGAFTIELAQGVTYTVSCQDSEIESLPTRITITTDATKTLKSYL